MPITTTDHKRPATEPATGNRQPVAGNLQLIPSLSPIFAHLILIHEEYAVYRKTQGIGSKDG